ncbi:MAG: hypothetical protein MZV64_72315 [Ignavibacteriales bacterium]|nr:hypothetical protein [Ignavibacteriales bacterium]
MGGDLGGARDPGPRRCASRASSSGSVLFNAPLPYLEGRHGRPAHAPGARVDRLLPAAGHSTPTPSRGSSRRPRCGGATSRRSTSRASGRTPARSRPRPSRS